MLQNSFETFENDLNFLEIASLIFNDTRNVQRTLSNTSHYVRVA